MKKTVWPNQGHPVKEVFVDEVARAFSNDDCLFIVFGGLTGIETSDSILKNEVVRLVVPLRDANKLFLDLAQAALELVPNDSCDGVTDSAQPSSDQKTHLGSPLSFSQ